MEIEAKRRKMNDRPIDLSSVDDIIVLDSGSDNEISIENEINESVALSGVSISNEGNEQNRVASGAANLTDDEKLKALLSEWGAISFLDNLYSCGITYKNLPFLDEEDYMMLTMNDYTQLGDMINFRTSHRRWKKSAMNKPSEKANRVIDVEAVLKNGGKAADEIMRYFETHLHLTDDLREKLIALILQQKRVLSRQVQNEIAGQICMLFPNETKFVYYKGGNPPTGLLFDRYNQSRRPKAIARAIRTNAEENLENLLTDELQASVDYLNNDENTDSTLIVQHWKATFHYREKKIDSYKTWTELFDDWPLLQKADGYVLIHVDYVEKYGTFSAESLKNEWDTFTFRNLHVLLQEIPDPKAKKALRESQSKNDINLTNRLVMMAMHNVHYLIPTKVVFNKVTWTPSIPDSKDAFLKEVSNKAAMDKEIKNRKDFCKLKMIKPHPLIFVMKNARNLEHFVEFDGIIYECDSLIDAVDTAFQIFAILKIPFPPECVKVWLFLNQIFYGIKLSQRPTAKMISKLDSFRF